MNEQKYSIYIADREKLDDGFSAGWGFHFPPSEEYVVDCHNHADYDGNAEQFKLLLDRWFAYTEAYRQQKIVLFIKTAKQAETMQQLQKIDARAYWMLYPDEDIPPDVELIKRTKEMGACGLKLHNKEIMKGNAPADTWDGDGWREVFKWANDERFPLLWHVTQRVGYSPYHGGGFNSYFSAGQSKGIIVTNQELLDQFEKILDEYPDIPVIAAHQLYVGLDKLASLFDRHPNLYIDTSVGFFLRWCDTLNEQDRIKYHDFFMRYSDRILFGTDTSIVPEGIGNYQKEAFLCHLRFIHALMLPDKQLKQVCYQNAERLLNIPPSESARKFNTRP